ncbi:MAG: cell division transport system ATP-binding protein [Candidatus Parcubacteria bacterium]|jgi:cell division transport system ATP-binding protein|nr:cell division transport system ATP-binding protein [Candidatus Parcubacteria bacterium]
MIYYDKVTKVYPDKTVAIDNVSFGVEPKEFVTIVGQSGAGKTTLMKMLIAEDWPTEGAVYLESVNIHRLSKKQMNKLRRRIGMVFQDYRLIPNKTVYENIAFAMEAAGRTDGEIAADVPHVLELVDIGHKIWNFPRELSGGERQRLAIARAVVTQPDIVVADEPTGNLDPTNTYEIIRILQKINELGATVILTTHNKGVVDTVGGRVITMEKGKVVRDDRDGKYIL